MAFCGNCGSEIRPETKFCNNCGAPVPVAPQEAQKAREASIQAQGGSIPPAQQPQGVYAPPAQTAYAGAMAPKRKKPIDKKVFIFGGAALAVILVAVLLVSLLGGRGGDKSDDPNLGVWTAVSAEMWGVETDITDVFAKGFTIELLDRGKCTLNVDGAKGSGKWSLENGVFHIEGGGLDAGGTLKDGVLVLENVLGMGLKLTFHKEGAQSGKPSASGADYFVIQSVTQAGESYAGDDLGLIGLSGDYVLLYPDGSADLVYFGFPFKASWKEGELTLPGMGAMPYTVTGDELSLEPGEGMLLVYLRSADAPPAALTQTTDVSEGNDAFVSPTTKLEPGSYWYGATTISNYLPQSGAAGAEGTYDVWGVIDTDADGRPYFEVFEDAEMATVPILSMYIKLFDDSFWADVGPDDAWLFDIYLGTEDEWSFSPKLDNGALYMNYHCEGQNISFDIMFFLREDGAPWDEANDPLPPGYDDYKAGLGQSDPGDTGDTGDTDISDNTPMGENDTWGASYYGPGEADPDTLLEAWEWLTNLPSGEPRPTYDEVCERIGCKGQFSESVARFAPANLHVIWYTTDGTGSFGMEFKVKEDGELRYSSGAMDGSLAGF